MSPILCSNGHVNPPDSRFCRLCGEQMVAAPAQEIGSTSPPPGQSNPDVPANRPLVGLRYRMVRQLGHGGFGRAYLATDEQRFHEPCVLKEFAPKVEGAEALRKAESLFEREAGVLYRLQHDQIPRFRELLRAEFDGRDRLFLVQDYVDGSTYQELLDQRLQKGRYFTEPEILQFLSQILPVLDYIHRMGVIHRDISPDNLICRGEDECPVLIDFGGVKQASVTIESALGGRSPQPAHEVTLVGKQGFAPREQMKEGRVKPHCDLHALAVTVLVLMSGQAPRDLLDADSAAHWETQISSMGPLLRSVLKQMLSDRPEDRYPSAQQVMGALGLLRLSSQVAQAADVASPNALANGGHAVAGGANGVPANMATPPQPGATAHTVAVSPRSPQPSPSQTTHSAPQPIQPVRPSRSQPSSQGSNHGSGWWQGVLAFLTIVILACVGGWVGYRWVPQWLNLDQGDDTAEQPAESGGDLDTESPQFSPNEVARKNALRSRRDALGVNDAFLVTLTDASFYDQYPGQRGRNLTDQPEDADWRERWDAIAADWLDTLESTLSEDARRNLGSYSQANRDQWKQVVNRLHVSSNALNDVADARFFHTFPDQRSQSFIDQPIGQIWHGMAAEAVRAMQSGQTLEDVRFAQGADTHEVRGELAPGGGQIYTLNLTENQRMQLDVDAPRGDVRLSIYIPRPTDDIPFLLEDARSLDWSGTLPQSGYYEVVIVSLADQPVDFQLSVEVQGNE